MMLGLAGKEGGGGVEGEGTEEGGVEADCEKGLRQRGSAPRRWLPQCKFGR